MMRKHGLAILLVATLLGATGCISFKKTAPEKHYYVLDVEHTGPRRQAPLDAVLNLAEVKISPRYDKNELIYRIGDLQYETDFYNEFFISPRELITGEALHWLGDSGLFTLVTGDDYRLGNSYGLTLAVNSLYGDYRDTSAPKAILNMQALVTDVDNSGRRSVLFTRDYSEQVPIADHSAEACVAGLNQALANILGRLEIDLASVVGDK